MDTHKSKQYPFRCEDEEFIKHIDAVAKEMDLNRNDYILRSLKNQLAEDLRPHRPKPKTYIHNFKDVEDLPSDVNEFIAQSKAI